MREQAAATPASDPEMSAGGFRFHMPATVRFGDLDIRGHMNNVALIEVLEAARVEYLYEIGMGPPTTYEIVVAHLTVDYRAAAEYRDELVCGVRTVRIGRSSIVLEQRIACPANQATLVDAQATLVWREGEPKVPSPVPDELRRCVAAWEPGAVEGASA